MLPQLFSSQVMFQVLAVLFGQPEKSFSTTEIIAQSGKKQANVQRELAKLVQGALVTKEKSGSQSFYRLNSDYRHFATLKNIFTEYSQTDRDWSLLNEESGSCILPIDYMLQGFHSDYGLKNGVVNHVLDCMAVYDNDYGKYYFTTTAVDQIAQESLQRMLQDPGFVFDIIYPETIEQGKKAEALFSALAKKNFKTDSRGMIALINQFLDIFCRQIGLNSLAALDLKDQVYSNYFSNYLQHQIKGTNVNLNLASEKLLAPEFLTYTQILRQEMIDLVISQKRDKKKIDLDRLLANWRWLNYGYMGPGLSREYFQEAIKELGNKSLTELLGEKKTLANYQEIIRAEKEKLFHKLKIDAKHQGFIKALSLLAFLKVYRKDTAFMLLFLQDELLKHLDLSLSLEQLRSLTLAELKEFLAGRLNISPAELRRRRRFSVCLYQGEKLKVLLGSAARDYLAEHLTKDNETVGQNIKLLEGTTACLGKTGDWIYGQVKIINSAADMKKMKAGDILVSIATTPEILSAMKLASAIVTDHGGITCHAAIVSRELNIPCLIATKYATKVFRDGDKVVVCPRHNYIKFQ